MTSPQLARLVAYGVTAIIACLLALLPLTAKATGSKPSTPASSPNASAISSSSAVTSAAANTSSTSNAVYGGLASDSSFYVLPAPVSGASLPAGICQRSQYRHLSIGWNFYSHANGDSFTDQGCLDAILAVQKARFEAANPPRLPDVPKACIHPEPKKQTKVQAVKRAKVCA